MRNEKSGDCPAAFIAKNKQRLKQYNDIVYLKNADEFEIELFNPTQSKVLARITINNASIGPGIILRPGERVFLERYVNDPKKFKFETYTVNGSDSQVQKAIENNGDVKVEFFAEEIKNYNSVYLNCEVSSIPETSIFYQTTSISNYPLKSYDHTNHDTLSCTSIGDKYRSVEITNTSASTNIDTLSFSDFNSDKQSKSGILSKKSDDIETGRVEKGSYSNQKFDADYTKFNCDSSWTSTWKILPESRKQITSDDLLIYCSCGRKQRKNEKFCPSCGKKINEEKIVLNIYDTVVILDKNAISVIQKISKNGNNEDIYYVPYPGDNRWYTKNQLEFNHSN